MFMYFLPPHWVPATWRRRAQTSIKILYTASTHIKAKANKHRKTVVTIEKTPKDHMDELNAQIDLDRTGLGKKPFDRDDDPPSGGGTVTKVVSTTDPDSGQQTREGKPDGFHYSEHRTIDLRNNVIVNVCVEPDNINGVTSLPEMEAKQSNHAGG